MRQIVPFKKELPFKTKVSDITSISLERDIDISKEGIVSGIFHITGDYKMNEGSINREDFSFDLPFDISLDPRYDIDTVKADIEDFYYDIINDDTLKVNIDLFIEAEYLPEPAEEKKNELLEELTEDDNRIEADNKDIAVDDDTSDKLNDCSDNRGEDDFVEINIENTNINDNNNTSENINSGDITTDLFSNLDNSETYATYYVYMVKEEDSIDKILTKYGITKEELEDYNEITDIKPGDKIIIPKKSE